MLVAVSAGVPSLSHELLVELFRRRPSLARELLSACRQIELDGVSAEQGSIDLTQVVPAEYRADAVTVLRDRQGKAVSAIIVEVQLEVDKHKLLTWPLYVTAARANLGCPVMLLILAPKHSVARWASRPIPTGHPGYVLRPIVIGSDQIPCITDAVAARESPELTVLSAVTRPDVAMISPVRVALKKLPEDRRKVYWDWFKDHLPARMSEAVEVSMKYNDPMLDSLERYLQARKRRLDRRRRRIVKLVGARSPVLRDEIEGWLRDQPESVLDLMNLALVAALDEAEMRGVMKMLSARPPEPPPVNDLRASDRALRRAGLIPPKRRGGRAAHAPRTPRTRTARVSRRAAT